MLRNELLIYFAQQSFYGGDTIKGYSELKCPLGITIVNVTGEFFCVEIGISKEGKQNKNILFKFDKVLEGPGSKIQSKGFLSSIFGSSIQPSTLSIGNHQYPFEFQLPHRVPPTYQGKNGKILYQIKVTANVVKGSTPLVSAADVIVAGTMFDLNFIGNSSTPISKQEHKTFVFASGIMNLTSFLPSSVFRAGDIIQGEFSVDNNTSKSIGKVRVDLVQRIQYAAGKKIVENNILCTNNIGGCEKLKPVKHPFRLQIPLSAPESLLDGALAEVKKLKYIKIQYFVELEGEISMAQNYRCSIPIFVIRPELQEKLLARIQQREKMSQLPPPPKKSKLPEKKIPPSPSKREIPKLPVPNDMNTNTEMNMNGVGEITSTQYPNPIQPPVPTEFFDPSENVYDPNQPVVYKQPVHQLQKVQPPPPPSSTSNISVLPPAPTNTNIPPPDPVISNIQVNDDVIISRTNVVEIEEDDDDDEEEIITHSIDNEEDENNEEDELVYPDIQYPEVE